MLRRLSQFVFGHGKPVIVVSGLPRSGTSMMMRMLEAGGLVVVTDGERSADEDNPVGYFEVERIKALETETDKTYIRQARGKALKVISFLIKDLPADNQYRVVFMRRDLDEVLASQAKMHDRLGSTNDFEPHAVKESFRNEIVRVRLFCRRKPNFEMVEVHYRETIDEPMATAQTVNAFLGGGLDLDAMVAAVDANLYRNRREVLATAPTVS